MQSYIVLQKEVVVLPLYVYVASTLLYCRRKQLYFPYMCMQPPLYCIVEGSSCTSLKCVCSNHFIVLQTVVVEQPVCVCSNHYIVLQKVVVEQPECVCSNHYIVLQKVVVEQPPMCMQQPLYCIVEDSSTASYVYLATTILYC